MYLLAVVVLMTARLCGCTAYADRGFSVELIHRDSPKSPFHDPSLTLHARLHARLLAAVSADFPDPDGAVSEVVRRGVWEYFMYVNIGTPRTRMLALLDSGSNLVWLKCINGSSSPPPPAAAGAPSDVFDLSSSLTYSRVGCQSDSCHAIHDTSCDATSFCQYRISYIDGTGSSGLISTETFTFDDAPGGCVGCRDRPQLQVARVNFGCATAVNFPATSVVGIGDGKASLINQMGAATSLGRRFSYCLTNLNSGVSSALNLGARAAVTEPGAVTTPMVHSAVEAYYTVEIVAFRVGDSIIKLPNRSPVIVDSGTTLTYLDQELLDPIVEALARSNKLPRKQWPSLKLFPLCYDVNGWELDKVFPDVTLELGGGALVTLKAENVFTNLLLQGSMCSAMWPVTPERPVATIGNIIQQNMHVGYDLDKRAITFAPADCATSYPSPPAFV